MSNTKLESVTTGVLERLESDREALSKSSVEATRELTKATALYVDRKFVTEKLIGLYNTYMVPQHIEYDLVVMSADTNVASSAMQSMRATRFVPEDLRVLTIHEIEQATLAYNAQEKARGKVSEIDRRIELLNTRKNIAQNLQDWIQGAPSY